MFQNCQVCEFCLSELFQYRAFATPYRAWPLLYNLIRIQTLNKSINSTQIPFEEFFRHPFNICWQHKTVRDVIRHHQTSANAIWCQHKPPQILEQPFWVSGNVCWCSLVSVGVCCCPEVSRDTWRSCESIWVKCMYVCRVWMRLWVYRSVKALNGAANALYWKISERQNSHT